MMHDGTELSAGTAVTASVCDRMLALPKGIAVDNGVLEQTLKRYRTPPSRLMVVDAYQPSGGAHLCVEHWPPCGSPTAARSMVAVRRVGVLSCPTR